MDYKEILIKYIHHVGECEGVDFISGKKPSYFNESEWDILNEASSAACDRFKEFRENERNDALNE